MTEIVSGVREYWRLLDATRKRLEPVPFEWYPYASLTNVQHLDMLLGSRHEEVLEAAKQQGILDIGCADGDFSFYLASLGYAVTAVDHPVSNHNAMLGVRALRDALRPDLEIHEVDIDADPLPCSRPYGLALFLGTLYHVKNPVGVMEKIARCSRYCVMSTRIARRLPDGSAIPEGHPLAYLLHEDELNRDDSNFWIFSEAGLRRLIQRTQWEIVEFMTVGDRKTSDPASLDRDERAFALLRSHYGLQHLELLEGWHGVEASGWRWTERRFSARAAAARGSALSLRIFVPPALIKKFGSITLRASLNGSPLPPTVFKTSGIHTYSRHVAIASEPAVIQFELDKALAPDDRDPRERGVIVALLELT